MRIASGVTVGMLLGAVIAVPLIPLPADAQIGQRIRDRAQRQVEQRAERRAADAVERALDEVECAVTDQRCVEQARAAGQEVVLTDAQGQPLGDGAPAPGAAAMRPGEGAWVNYDFVPGERVIFAEDFARDRVGDFPRRLEFRRGNMEVAEWQGQRWLRATTNAHFAIDLPETLPQRFTVELDFVGDGNAIGWLYFSGETRGQHVRFSSSGGGVQGGGISSQGRFDGGPGDEPRTLRVMADGRYVKVYLNETRVANVPNADLGRTNQIIAQLQASDRSPMLLRDFRIAAGGRELYDALTADGRVVTQGILFDTGSDRIRPESTPTLQEIGEMLRQHGDLRLRIEGHTDSVGDAATNQALSERRAESVRRYLVERFDVDAGRLEAAGLGQERPVDSNDTPEGRQNNRRVELVRL